MLTIQKFAEEKNISKPILDTWIYRQGLPVVRIGRRNYIREEDFDAWIESHKQVYTAKPKQKSFELAVPKKCRTSSIAMKIHRIY